MPYCYRCRKPKYCVTHELSCPGNPNYERYEKELENKKRRINEHYYDNYDNYDDNDDHNNSVKRRDDHPILCGTFVILSIVILWIITFPWTIFKFRYDEFNVYFENTIINYTLFSLSKSSIIIFEFKIYMMISPLLIIFISYKFFTMIQSSYKKSTMCSKIIANDYNNKYYYGERKWGR
jgi:hypothetical protein